jgi:hypothetical protein
VLVLMRRSNPLFVTVPSLAQPQAGEERVADPLAEPSS